MVTRRLVAVEGRKGGQQVETVLNRASLANGCHRLLGDHKLRAPNAHNHSGPACTTPAVAYLLNRSPGLCKSPSHLPGFRGYQQRRTTARETRPHTQLWAGRGLAVFSAALPRLTP